MSKNNIIVSLDETEQLLIQRALSEMRDNVSKINTPTEDIDDLVIKINAAPFKKGEDR